jgi:hypothetical protein
MNITRAPTGLGKEGLHRVRKDQLVQVYLAMSVKDTHTLQHIKSQPTLLNPDHCGTHFGLLLLVRLLILLHCPDLDHLVCC